MERETYGTRSGAILCLEASISGCSFRTYRRETHRTKDVCKFETTIVNIFAFFTL